MVEEARFRHDAVSIGGSVDLLFLDLYRLVTLFMASRELARAAGTNEYHPFAFLGELHDRSEAARLLVNIAVRARASLDTDPDQTWRKQRGTPRQVGTLKTASEGRWKNSALSFRDACNKIIHAHSITFDRRRGAGTIHPHIASVVYLHGDHNGREWKAALKVIDFVDCAFRAS